ncbi:hypothetical protein DL96DRAFT_1579853 [Flagelloscypha sp. PMI_526]|nr:hypothetical protein DL96DRAFT_1579853 [Flagelloscypha sp. PMI_526]
MMILSQSSMALVVLSLHFGFAYGQNATIYGVLGEDIPPISPLPTATFSTESNGYYIYNVLPSSINFTVYNFPVKTLTLTDKADVYGPTSTVKTTISGLSYISGSPTDTPTTAALLTTTMLDFPTIATTTITATRTDHPSPLVIPYYHYFDQVDGMGGTSFRVSTNGTYVEHHWYQPRTYFTYNCDLSTATCNYSASISGNNTYTGKVVPMWVVSNAQTGGQANEAYLYCSYRSMGGLKLKVRLVWQELR